MSTKLVLATTIYVAVSVVDFIDAANFRKKITPDLIMNPKTDLKAIKRKITKRNVRQVAFLSVGVPAAIVTGRELAKLIKK